MRQYVTGEASTIDYDLSAIGPSVGDKAWPEAPIDTTEPQLTDKTELAEDLESGDATPTPTAQQRKFSVDWDPIR